MRKKWLSDIAQCHPHPLNIELGQTEINTETRPPCICFYVCRYLCVYHILLVEKEDGSILVQSTADNPEKKWLIPAPHPTTPPPQKKKKVRRRQAENGYDWKWNIWRKKERDRDREREGVRVGVNIPNMSYLGYRKRRTGRETGEMHWHSENKWNCTFFWKLSI